MSVQSLYNEKKMSASEAIQVVRNHDAIIVPTGVGEPPALLTALSEVRRNYEGVQVMQILPLRKYGYFDPETYGNIYTQPLAKTFSCGIDLTF